MMCSFSTGIDLLSIQCRG